MTLEPMWDLYFCNKCFQLLPPLDVLHEMNREAGRPEKPSLCPNCDNEVEYKSGRITGEFNHDDAVKMLRESFGEDVV